MELSGTEVRELFDFVARNTAARSCSSVAQIAGARVRLNCSGCDPEPAARHGRSLHERLRLHVGRRRRLRQPSNAPGAMGTCAVTPCAEEIYIGQVTDRTVTPGHAEDADCCPGQTPAGCI